MIIREQKMATPSIVLLFVSLIQWTSIWAYPGSTKEDCDVFKKAMEQLLERIVVEKQKPMGVIDSVMKEYPLTASFAGMNYDISKTSIEVETHLRDTKKGTQDDVGEVCIHHLEIVQTILRRIKRGDSTSHTLGSLARSATLGEYVCSYIERAKGAFWRVNVYCAKVRPTRLRIKEIRQKLAKIGHKTSSESRQLSNERNNLLQKKEALDRQFPLEE